MVLATTLILFISCLVGLQQPPGRRCASWRIVRSKGRDATIRKRNHIARQVAVWGNDFQTMDAPWIRNQFTSTGQRLFMSGVEVEDVQ